MYLNAYYGRHEAESHEVDAGKLSDVQSDDFKQLYRNAHQKL